MAACPAAGGGGTPPSYLCENGTAVDGTTDASTDAGRLRCSQCNPLYKLNGVSGAIGTTCQQVALGEATRIGTVSQFGVSEDFPFGLAAMGNTLYMVGQSNDVLYSLNIDPDDTIADGSADQVGSLAAGFGVGERTPTGLAAIGTGLYMVGGNNISLFTLNTSDGSATRVGSLGAGFGVGENSPSGLAAIGATLYMVGLDNRVLYTLNITSGDGTPDGTAIQVGSLAAGFGVDESPTGLAALGNTLYMVGQTNDALYALRYR